MTMLCAAVVLLAPADDAIDTFVKAEMARQHIPGLTVLVKQNGKVLKHQSYGFSNLEKKVPSKNQDRYDMGSIGKTFTAAAIMRFVDDGKLSLSDTVGLLLPGSSALWKDISVKQLLSQASGISDYAFQPGIGLADTYTKEKWLADMGKLPLDFETGRFYQYSNSNYVLLGHILEKLTGKNYSDCVLSGVLKKGGLKTVAFDGKTPIPNRPKGYYFQDGKFVDAGEGGVAAVPSDGGGFCTTEDLTRWLEACNAGRVVKPETIAQMQAPNVLSSGRKTAYGLGWMNRRINNHLQSSHGGNSVGFSATMSNFPNQKLTITMMCNLYPVGGDDFALGLARVLEPDLRPKPVKDGEDPNPERTATLSKALTALAVAEIESPLFHADMQARLKTGRGRMALEAYATMKDFKLTFVDERDEVPDHVVRYRAAVGSASFLVEFFVDPSGLIYSIARQADPGKA